MRLGEAFRDLHALAGTLLALGVLGALFWGLYRLTRVLDERLAEWAAKTESRLDDLVTALLGKSLRVVVPVMGVTFALPILALPVRYAGPVTTATSIMLIGALAVILFQAVGVFEDAMLGRFDIKASDNLEARKVYTRAHVFGRLIRVLIGVFVASSVLMLFDSVRHIGTSLLASAGIVGIVAGIAAQRTLANLFAGFQIALSQPIRQDDVVVVEGEWGRIEEITLTYVVVHIWDDRRLVVPLGYFIEKPFQNWTRNSAQLLGSVLVWVDYSFPVEKGRAELKRIIEGNPLWDGRDWNLQVTDANERSMQLRVLATSADSSKSWDLRCQIREQFIDFISDAHPCSLPLVRAHVQK
jgi:small-conductance mechanosensitive channel